MSEIRIIETLRNIPAESWNACFANEVENYEYLLSIEEAGLKGFSWCYATAWQGSLLLAAMPAFLSDYALDTTLQGTSKKITSAIASAFPNLLKVKLACLGSPCTEAGIIGFHPQLNVAEKEQLSHAMVAGFERYAEQHHCKLIGIKDIPETLEAIWKPGITALKYATLPGMPTASLEIDFADMDTYMARLSYSTRKNMRRKMKEAEKVRIEVVHSLAEVLPQIMALYHDTRGRSEWQFEELTEAYFQGVLVNMPKNAFCTLYYVGDQLLAANLLVHNEHTLIDKFFCMNSEIGREYNLYFLSWFTNIRLCLERGFKHYQSGQAYYENKVRLGSKLTRNHMYFKHRNVFAQRILKLAAPLLSADETLDEAA